MGNSNNGKLIAALLTGAAIGGALGILFAPDKGSETRKKIAEKSNELTGTVKDKFSAIVNKFKKEVETINEQAKDLADNGQSVVENLKRN
jgi:gas vesicle protein